MKTGTLDLNMAHAKENNIESYMNYLANIQKFSRQNTMVFEQMMTGQSITVKQAMLHMDINSLPRRIKDLRDIHGIPVKDRWSSEGHFKEYYLEIDFINKYPNND